MNSLKRVPAFQIELEFKTVGFYGEGKTGEPRETALGAKERTSHKLNPGHIGGRRVFSTPRHLLLPNTSTENDIYM